MADFADVECLWQPAEGTKDLGPSELALYRIDSLNEWREFYASDNPLVLWRFYRKCRQAEWPLPGWVYFGLNMIADGVLDLADEWVEYSSGRTTGPPERTHDEVFRRLGFEGSSKKAPHAFADEASRVKRRRVREAVDHFQAIGASLTGARKLASDSFDVPLSTVRSWTRDR